MKAITDQDSIDQFAAAGAPQDLDDLQEHELAGPRIAGIGPQERKGRKEHVGLA